MKKKFLVVLNALSLCFISCDDSVSDEVTSANGGFTNEDIAAPDDSISIGNNEKAAYGLALINEAMQNISLLELDSLIKTKSMIPAPSMGIMDPLSIPLGTLYNAQGMKIDAALIMGLRDGVGIGLSIDLNDYQVPTMDGSEVAVTGKIDLLIAYQTQYLIDQNIVLEANTPSDNQLLFTGGLMDGQKVGLNNVEVKFNVSQFSLGSPFAVKGTVLINDFPLYVNSEILELLMNFI
jgi:hypothetical protein